MKNIQFNINKLIPTLFIIFILLFYYNSRVTLIHNMKSNSKNTISNIQELTMYSLDTLFNKEITDNFIEKNIDKSFSNESLNIYKKINTTLSESELTATFSIDKINDFDSYIVENKRCYYFNANINVTILTKDGQSLSNENKTVESYIVEDSEKEKAIKIFQLKLKNIQ